MTDIDINKLPSNPYIDYDLLNLQKEFSQVKNRQFECKHTVSLNSLSVQKSQSNDKDKIKYFKFEWNEDINHIYKSDTKHMLYLIYLSLLKVEKKQIFKNKYYIKLGRNEKVLKLLDKEAIMTNLIEFYLEDKVNNKIDGHLLKTMKIKDFINNILTRYGGTQCSMGWSVKIYSKLINDIKCKDIKGMIMIPNYKYETVEIDDCDHDKKWNLLNVDDIVNALQCTFKKTQKYFLQNYKLKSYQNDIIRPFKHMNGNMIQSMNKQQLIQKINQCLPQNEKQSEIQRQIHKLVDIFLNETQ